MFKRQSTLGLIVKTLGALILFVGFIVAAFWLMGYAVAGLWNYTLAAQGLKEISTLQGVALLALIHILTGKSLIAYKPKDKKEDPFDALLKQATSNRLKGNS